MPLDDARLAQLLRRYAAFPSRDQAAILAAVVINLGRSIGLPQPGQDPSGRWNRWQEARRELATDGRDLERVLTLADALADRSRRPLARAASPGLLAELGEAIAALPARAEAHLGAGLALHEQGLPPLLAYAFNSWHIHAERPAILGRRLAELVTMGLYRLAGTAPDPRTSGETTVASGGIADLARTVDGRIRKVPRNYAARMVLLPEEHRNFRWLARSPVSDRIPRQVTFDTSTACLTREFIEGRDGLAVLADQQCLTAVQQADLAGLYLRLQSAMDQDGTVLDLHPGNFVWTSPADRWFLIDLGPVPSIGSGEYRATSFDAYYRHTWLDRRHREHVEPVRSIDYDLPDRTASPAPSPSPEGQ